MSARRKNARKRSQAQASPKANWRSSCRAPVGAWVAVPISLREIACGGPPGWPACVLAGFPLDKKPIQPLASGAGISSLKAQPAADLPSGVPSPPRLAHPPVDLTEGYSPRPTTPGAAVLQTARSATCAAGGGSSLCPPWGGLEFTLVKHRVRTAYKVSPSIQDMTCSFESSTCTFERSACKI